MKKYYDSNALVADVPLGVLQMRDLMEITRFSRRFIEGQIKSGKLRARKISPRAIRFLRSDVMQWLERASTARSGNEIDELER